MLKKKQILLWMWGIGKMERSEFFNATYKGTDTFYTFYCDLCLFFTVFILGGDYMWTHKWMTIAFIFGYNILKNILFKCS